MGFSTALVVAGGGEAVLIGFDMFAHFASTDQPTNESFNQFLNVRGEAVLFALVVLSLLKLGKNIEITAHSNYCRKDKSLLKGPNVLALDVGHY